MRAPGAMRRRLLRAPRIAPQMVDVLGRLHGISPREPDEIDRLKQRRAERLAAANPNGRGLA